MSTTSPQPRFTIRLRRLDNGAGLPLPAYQTSGAAGMDLAAAVPAGATVTIAPGARALVPTGFAFEIPVGYELQVRPRSGRHGITVLNSPGTVDSDYRGEVQVILVNLGGDPFEVRRGDRIAQAVICPVTQASIVETDEISDTSRGTGGFGSTGRD